MIDCNDFQYNASTYLDYGLLRLCLYKIIYCDPYWVVVYIIKLTQQYMYIYIYICVYILVIMSLKQVVLLTF